MFLPDKQRVAAVCGDGRLRLVERDLPRLERGAVLVEVHASLVSPGTELGGWRGLADKRKKPDAGAEPQPFGYSNAGMVLETGKGVKEFEPGDRVACVGAGYALHADYAAAPHHLCVRLPEEVSFAQGSYAMLLATAMHAVRRCEPELGESTAVAGLGLVGMLTARLMQLAGNYAMGWDTIPFRTELARKWGLDGAITIGEEDEVERTLAFTGGRGLDSAFVAFGGARADGTMESLGKCMKCTPDGHRMGRVVIVGSPTFEYAAPLDNMDIRRASRTGFGYHDEGWEFGRDYPATAMRWTTRTNLELCVRLLAEGKVDVDALTTHTVALKEVEEETSKIVEEPDSVLGMVFTMT